MPPADTTQPTLESASRDDWEAGVAERFIVLEGLDGAGTSTQLERLHAALLARGKACMATCEPTESPVGRLIRSVVGGTHPMAPQSLALLFAADRSEHLSGQPDGVLAALARGTIVASDRYLFSSLAYQALDSPFDYVVQLNRRFLLPRHLFFLDTPLEVCQQRVAQRERRELFELEEVQHRLRASYQRVLDYFADGPVAVHSIDGSGSREAVFERIWMILEREPILTR
jgi:dTMP kinase